MTAIALPELAFIPCPKITFRPRAVSACASCDCFSGIVDTQPDAKEGTPTQVRYRIACAHPIARRFEVIDAGP